MMRMKTVGCQAVLCLVVLAGYCAPARAQDANKVDAAKRFLTDTSRAKGVLFFMHPTAEFTSVRCVEQLTVIDTTTRAVRKDWFCLKVRYHWKSGLFNDAHTSDMLFYFNERGRFVQMQPGVTSTFVRPFTASNVVIAAVKDKLLENVKDEENKRVLRNLIAGGDARALLTWVLQMDQR